MYGTPSGSVTETDNSTNFPVNATVNFVMGNGTITVTLSNLEGNTFFDSQNLSGIAFGLNGGSTTSFTGTAASGSSTDVINPGGTGSTASAHPITENTTPTTGNSELANITPSWALSNVGSGGTFDGQTVGANEFVLAIASGSGSWNGVNSIVGTGPYNGINPVGQCPGAGAGGIGGSCNSGDPIVTPTSPSVGSGYTQALEEMIYGSVTFTLNITGVTTASTITGPVTFIFGPDGPDADDLVTGQFETPEPAAFYLCGAGLLTIVVLRFWRLRHRLAFAALQPFAGAIPETMIEESFEPQAGRSASRMRAAALRLARWKRKLSNSC